MFYREEGYALHETDPVTRNRNPGKEPLGLINQGIDPESIFDELR
jgi:hypothetical protein